MSNYVNLNIKINLEGDIKDTIPIYNYSTHSNPSSTDNNIYIPLKTLIGDEDAFKNNIYSKNPKQIFFTTTRLIEFLTNRPKIFHTMSKTIYTKLFNKKKEIEQESNNSPKLQKKLQKEYTELEEYINKSNIDLVVSLFFKKNTYFLYKNEKYIINSYKISNYGLNTTNIILPTYNELVNDIIQEKSKSLFELNKFKYKNINKGKLTSEKENELREEAFQTVINEYTTNIISDKITKYTDFIIENLNKKAIKNNEPIRYIYEKYVGIKTLEDRSANKYISIKLNVSNQKTKHISNIKLNTTQYCKTKKNKINSLIKKIFGILDPPTKEELEIYESEAYLNFDQVKNSNSINNLDSYKKWKKLSQNQRNIYINEAKKYYKGFLLFYNDKLKTNNNINKSYIKEK